MSEVQGVRLVATNAAEPGLFELFAGVVERGEGFPQTAPLDRGEYDEMWGHAAVVVTAHQGDELVGAAYLKPNGPGLGGHIANAGYVVAPDRRGRGIGRWLVEDTIARAPDLGFDAIQFNFVFESNPARRLYERLGWVEVGRIPQAIGDQAAFVYWRAVGPG
ncbi:MAG TPA: GNAT family N-acetyltransferase [Acidimicrobiales bacterium]